MMVSVFSFCRYTSIILLENRRKCLKTVALHIIIKYLVLGMSKTAFNIAMKNEELACQLTEIVFKSIDTECQGLCKKENDSILRRISPADLVDLKLEN